MNYNSIRILRNKEMVIVVGGEWTDNFNNDELDVDFFCYRKYERVGNSSMSFPKKINYNTTEILPSTIYPIGIESYDMVILSIPGDTSHVSIGIEPWDV
jgi:hypothetical protein